MHPSTVKKWKSFNTVIALKIQTDIDNLERTVERLYRRLKLATRKTIIKKFKQRKNCWKMNITSKSLFNSLREYSVLSVLRARVFCMLRLL